MSEHGFSRLSWHSHIEAEALHPWRLSRTHLTENLQPILAANALLAPEGPLRRETLWCMALQAISAGNVRTDPIPLSQLEDILGKLPSGVPIQFGSTNHTYTPTLIDALRLEIQKLRQDGESSMPFPHLAPDVTPPFVEFRYSSWESYSDEQMIELIRQVYADALEGYAQLVDTYFPKFAIALPTYTLLPVKLTGFFCAPKRDQPRWSDSGPWLGRFMDVLAPGSKNGVEIINGDFQMLEDAQDKSYNRRQLLRPTRIENQRMSMIMGGPPVFGPDPATRLAYSWLRSDLNDVGWLSRSHDSGFA